MIHRLKLYLPQELLNGYVRPKTFKLYAAWKRQGHWGSTELAQTERLRVSRHGWKPAITRPGARAGLNWPLAPTARREMAKSHFVIFQSFFPEKRPPALRLHTQTSSVREGKCYQGGYLWKRYLGICGCWGYLCWQVCVCVGVKEESVSAAQFSAKAHTWPQDSVGKFFACFLNEPQPP